MNLKQHLTDKSLREYLTGRLGHESEREADLHLSFCMICQEARGAALLDLAFSGRDSGLFPGSPHPSDKDLLDFWGDAPQDRRWSEELSRHCLQCRPCRDRRHLLWQEVRSQANAQPAEPLAAREKPGAARTEAREQAATTRGRALVEVALVAGLVALARRRRQAVGVIVAFAGVGFMALVFTLLKGGSQAPTSLSVVHRRDATPSLSPTREGWPVIPEPPQILPAKEPRPRTSKPAPPAPKSRLRAAPARETPEELAQYQGLDVRNDPATASFRGADEESSRVDKSHSVIIARRGRTRIDISLPEGSLSGNYSVYVQEPARLSTLAEGKGFSADGARLSVSINLRRLPPGEYSLCVTRRDEAGTEEYLGNFPIQAVGPPAKATPGRK
jgi:hypothetical protein